MPYFPSLPIDAGVRHVVGLNRAAGRALIELHVAALRNESALPARDKELIAAFVSALNACQYCFGVHAETARAFGIAEGLLEGMVVNLEAAPVEPRLKPILAYARKLTLAPAKVTQADADAVFAAGWSETEFHDAILTACLFNFMNRLVDGHGVKGSPALFAARGRALFEEGYALLLEMLDGKQAA